MRVVNNWNVEYYSIKLGANYFTKSKAGQMIAIGIYGGS